MSFIEPIELVLSTCGETLTFPTFTILGLPGFSLTNLYSGETSVYTVEKQVFAVQILSSDAVTNGISKGNTFTLSDKVYEHSFRLESAPIPDLTGFSKLNVAWIGKVDV